MSLMTNKNKQDQHQNWESCYFNTCNNCEGVSVRHYPEETTFFFFSKVDIQRQIDVTLCLEKLLPHVWDQIWKLCKLCPTGGIRFNTNRKFLTVALKGFSLHLYHKGEVSLFDLSWVFFLLPPSGAHHDLNKDFFG